MAINFQILNLSIILDTVSAGDTKGYKVFIVVPSLDTGVCNLEIKIFEKKALDLKDINLFDVSLDLPFVQARWCSSNFINEVKTLSDYKDRSFGFATGKFIKEFAILARTVFIVDKDGTLLYAEYVKEVRDHPYYDKVFAKLLELSGYKELTEYRDTEVKLADVYAKNSVIKGDGIIRSAYIMASNVTLQREPSTLKVDYKPNYVNQNSTYNINFTIVNGNNVPITDAKVSIDGNSKITNDDGTVEFNLQEKNYKVVVTKEGFKEYTENITVNTNISGVIQIFASSQYNVGFIIKDSNTPLSGVTVSLSNLSNKTTDSNGQVYFNNIEAGYYRYTLTKSGYQTESGNIRVPGTETINMTKTILKGNLTIEDIPNGLSKIRIKIANVDTEYNVYSNKVTINDDLWHI